MMVKNTWRSLPPLVLSSPVFALAVGPQGLWASGTGGIAWYTESRSNDGPVQESAQSQQTDSSPDGWSTRIVPLSSVTALLYKNDLLLAGGLEGIAFSSDGGLHWERALQEDPDASITALAASPRFVDDDTLVAGTLAHGILRSEDRGRTWVSASFGLESFEVTALAWFSGSVVLAATSDGIYRSSDAGRAWRRVYLHDDLNVDALIYLSEKEILAAMETGGLLRSTDRGAHWSFDDALQEVHILSLFVDDRKADNTSKQVAGKASEPTGHRRLFAGTLERGLLRSDDKGATWEEVYQSTVISFAAGNKYLYAGTDSGVSRSDDGGYTWRTLSYPPVYDLAHLFIYEGQPMLMGPYAGLVRSTGSDWEAITDLHEALTSVALAPDGSLLTSSPTGLMRLPGSEEAETGGERQMLVEGQEGQVSNITFRCKGASWQVWAASADGTRLLRSNDEGKTWQTLRNRFGVLPVVALQAMPDRIVAATYDPRQQRVCIWFSKDDGDNWERGIEAGTPWPVVAMHDDPPLITLGNIILIQNESGKWQEVRVGNDGGMIRRVISVRQKENNTSHASSEDATQSTSTILFALTTTGIQRSDDGGASWRRDHEGAPVEQMIDIAASDTALYVFLVGGQVWRRSL